MEESIKVLVRVKPSIQVKHTQPGLRVLGGKSIQVQGQIFSFDHVVQSKINDESQQNIFDLIAQPIIQNCFNGYNGTIFAYGQTSSGKTFTMQGRESQSPVKNRSPDKISSIIDSQSQIGLIPRSIQNVFSQIQQSDGVDFSVKCSFIEIYNEQVYDLFSSNDQILQVRYDLKRGVYVDGAQEINVKTMDETMQLFHQGNTKRRIAATSLNRESSRSHSIFTIFIQSKVNVDGVIDLKESRLNFCDLAGSERQGKAETSGDRLKEAGNINKSLLALGNVINALVEKSKGKERHIHYRDSKLTFLLKDSLGGNALCRIIANISQEQSNIQETLSTLKFADRAKMIKNCAIINQEFQGDYHALIEEIHRLKHELLLLQSNNGNLKSSGSNSSLHKNDTILSWALQDMRNTSKQRDQLKEELQILEQYLNQLNQQLQNEKMIIKLRDSVIKELKTSGNISDHELQEEIKFLRMQIDNNPQVTKFAAENLQLQNELNQYKEYIEQINKIEEIKSEQKKIQYALSDRIIELESELKSIKEQQNIDTVKAHPELIQKLQELIKKHHQVCSEKIELQNELKQKEADLVAERQQRIIDAEQVRQQFESVNIQNYNQDMDEINEKCVQQAKEIQSLQFEMENQQSQMKQAEEKFHYETSSLQSLINDKSLEIESYQKEISELKIQQAAIEEQKEYFKQQFDEVNAKYNQIELELTEYKSRQNDLDSQYSTSLKRIDELEQKLQKEQNLASEKDGLITELRINSENQCMELQKQVEGLTTINTKLQAQMDHYIEESESKVDKSVLHDVQQKFESNSLQLAEYEKQILELKAQKEKIICDQQQNSTEIDARIIEKNNKIKLLSEELQTRNEEISEQKTSFNRIEQDLKLRLQSEIKMKEDVITEQSKELDRYASDFDSLRQYVSQLESQLSEFNLKIEQFDSIKHQLESKLSEYDQICQQLQVEQKRLEIIDKKLVKLLPEESDSSLEQKFDSLLRRAVTLEEENTKLIAHNNYKQKVQYHLQIKQENNDLKQENLRLTHENERILKRLKELESKM